jgi:hypothetical protein
MFTIKSIVGSIHDTSFGGYPYKVTVTIELPVNEFNRLCPQTGKAKTTMFGRKPAPRDLGNLVMDVNKAVYLLNPNIRAVAPSIDSKGSRRATKGIKTLIFEYFDRDHARAEALGFELLKLKNGEVLPKYGQYLKIAHVEK